MRYYEIIGHSDTQQLEEGLLDSLRTAVGSSINSTLTAVNNTATAAGVIYNIGSNPAYCESMTFLLKKNLKQLMQSAGNNILTQAIAKVFPAGRTLIDFLVALTLNAVMTAYGKAGSYAKEYVKDAAKDAATNALKWIASKVVNIDAMLGSVTSASGIFAILAALKVGNDLFFALLSRLNQKIANASKMVSSNLSSATL